MAISEYYIPIYDRYGKELRLTRKQRRLKNWVEDEIETEKFEMLRRDRIVLGRDKMNLFEPTIRDEITNGFIVAVTFGGDKKGNYIEVRTDGHAHDILYDEINEKDYRWRCMSGRFHQRFEREFGIGFDKVGNGIMRAYYG